MSWCYPSLPRRRATDATAALAAGLIVACASTTNAGITLGTPQVEAQGGVSVVGMPTILLTGAGTPSDPFKISGHADFLNDDSGPATVRVAGTLSANAGDVLTASYDMTVDWDPDYDEGLAEFIFRGAIFPAPFPAIPFQLAQGVFNIGSHQYLGSESFVIPAEIGPVGFELEMYIYISQLGTLSLDIPTNSIDIALGPAVPEPSGAVLFAACLACGMWRRRASVT